MRTGKIKGALLAFVLALVAACGVACGGTTSDAKIVITGTPENGVVTLTDSVNTLQLGYELSEGKGDVVWRSGDEEIATVDDSGKVTLIDSGAVVITATLDKTDVKADALLTVKDERAVTDTITLSGMPKRILCSTRKDRYSFRQCVRMRLLRLYGRPPTKRSLP